MTHQQAVQFATDRLAADEHLRDSARRDAETLLMHVASLTRTDLLAHPGRELDPAHLAAYQDAITRRLRHEPIQYIAGSQEFFGLDFAVTPAVLIPRPETEHLVEDVLKHLQARLPHDRPLAIADIGTGSGAIAIALAAHLPHAHITAIDLSPSALAVAQANAHRHGLDRRIDFFLCDLLEALPTDQQTAYFDVIVSNPPYIPTTDAPQLHPQVREHEPASALFAGADGLEIYRRLIPLARQALKPGGLLALEIGYGQREAVTALLHDWHEVSFLDDLQGIPRVVRARR